MVATSRTRWRRLRPFLCWIVAAGFTVSGVLHLVRPSIFTGIIPHILPWPSGLVRVSGVAEIVCAFGLWRRERWAGLAGALLLVVIWPANLQAALTAQQGSDTTAQVMDWVRLPLQLPLIWLSLQAGRSGPPPGDVFGNNT